MSTFARGNTLALLQGGPGDAAALLWQNPDVRRALGVLAVFAACWLAVQILRRALHGREQVKWRRGSRYVEIAAPGAVDESGGAVFWDHLAAMSRPAWRRFWFGQPWVVWEL